MDIKIHVSCLFEQQEGESSNKKIIHVSIWTKHTLALYNENYTELSLAFLRHSVEAWKDYGQKRQAFVYRNAP